VKLKKLDEWNSRRRAVAARYQALLRSESDLTLPFVPAWAEPVWHLFVVQHPQRDRLQHALAEALIGTMIHYPVPPHLSGAYAEGGWKRGVLPIAEDLAATVLSLPMGPHLTSDHADVVIGELSRAVKSLEEKATV
jgi:dTDP-4-amino-4,6-dideoxygalactose transaminase